MFAAAATSAAAAAMTGRPSLRRVFRSRSSLHVERLGCNG